MLWMAYTFFSVAQASDWVEVKKQNRINSVRMGVCVGLSPECMALGFSLGFAYEFIGVNLSLGPANGSFNVKLYPPVQSLVRPYAYAGVGMIAVMFGYMTSGVGVGVDMNLGSRVIFQPSVGLNFNYQQKDPTGSVAVLFKI